MASGSQEGFNDDLRFLADVVRVKFLVLANDLCRTAGRHIRVVLGGLCDLETGVVGHVVLEDIKNKALLDSLPHTVNVERMERTILIFSAEQFQGLVLRSCGERKERQILMLTVDDNLLH